MQAPTSPDITHLPLIQRPLDNTALKAYMACPREYQYSMLEHRRAKGKKAALVYGTSWHTILETHYKTNGDRERVRLEAIKGWEGHDQEETDFRTLNRALLDYDAYVKEFGTPEQEAASSQGETVGGDNPFVELTSNAMGGGLIHPYAVKIDRVIKLGGLYYIEDHKTTSRFDKNTWKQFELSQQMMGYVFIANLILPGIKVVGARINLAHILTKSTNFKRQLFTYSPGQLEEWKDNTNDWMSRVNDSHLIAAIQAGDIPENMPEHMVDWYRNRIAWPAHFGDDGCSRKYGMCAYHRVCSVSPRIRHRVLEQEFEVNPWNPMDIGDDIE